MCPTDRISLLNTCGMEAFNKGYYEDALYYLGMAADRARLAGTALQEARIRNNIGLVFRGLGNPTQAEIHFKLALSLIEKKEGTATPLHSVVASNLRELREAV
ncbi:MAG: tetratricopeptide repeat protein [Desulfovibrio sp.]|nr:tetratricopeptide repeat protein [Desulfovibrio sp.]